MSLCFVLGFSAVFITLGASATALGHLLLRFRAEANLVGGVGLLAAYAVGLGVPFLLAAVFFRELVGRLKTLRHAGRGLQVLAGLVMVMIGVAMMTGQLTALSLWLLERFPVLGRIG
jgi:cytochrome c-type biogenesis protein